MDNKETLLILALLIAALIFWRTVLRTKAIVAESACAEARRRPRARTQPTARKNII